MTVHDLQLKLIEFQKEGLRLFQMCKQYPGISVSAIPGYDAWLNNLYQYEQTYLYGHHLHTRFQSWFEVGNSQVELTQLLNYLDIVNKDQLYWDSLKQHGLRAFQDGRANTYGEIMSRQQVDNQSGSFQQTKPTVFLSYNWGSEKTVDKVEKRIKPIAVVQRDKSSIGPWGSITEFMKGIRTIDLVVVIISDAYLKSVACLYEIMQLLKDDSWISHSMFLVEDSAKGLYNSVGQLEYVKYWETERNKLEKALDGINPALVTLQADELKRIQLIQLNINDFMKGVADRNNPNLTQAIDAVEERVRTSKCKYGE